MILPLSIEGIYRPIIKHLFKEKFFKDTESAGLKLVGRWDRAVPQTHFGLFAEQSYKWGNYLNLRAN